MKVRGDTNRAFSWFGCEVCPTDWTPSYGAKWSELPSLWTARTIIKKRRRHSAACKFWIALEALEGIKKINRLSSDHEIHANLIRIRKRQLPKDGHRVFNNHESLDNRTPAEVHDML